MCQGKSYTFLVTLSQAPVNNPADHLATDDIELYTQTLVHSLPKDTDASQNTSKFYPYLTECKAKEGEV